MNAQWPKLERIARNTSGRFVNRRRKDASSLDYGYDAAGADGGIGGAGRIHQYLLEPGGPESSFIEARAGCGKTDEAAAWRREYDDFMAGAFRRAAARDMAQGDAEGKWCPSILMGDAGARNCRNGPNGGFAMRCIPARIFAQHDPAGRRNMAMFWATEPRGHGLRHTAGMRRESGMTPASLLYGHAWLWQGNGPKAAHDLYAYANHAAPVTDWARRTRPPSPGGRGAKTPTGRGHGKPLIHD